MKKVLSIVLSIAMVLCMMPAMAFAGTTSAQAAATYSDTAGTACEGAVNVLSALGVVNGYSDGTYKPEQVVTRAEMAKLIVTALGVDKYATATTSKFTDMGTASWAIPYVEYASNLNIVNGYGYGLFGPNDTVTYEQAVTMIVRALGYTDACKEMNGSWPAIYVQKATALGLFTDVVNGGAAGADRGDVAIMLFNALNLPEVYADGDGGTQYKTGNEEFSNITLANGSVLLGVSMLYTLNQDGSNYYDIITNSDVDSALYNISNYVGALAKIYKNKDGDIIAIGDIKTTLLTGTFNADKDEFTADGTTYRISASDISGYNDGNGSTTRINSNPEYLENGTYKSALADFSGIAQNMDVTLAVTVSGTKISKIFSMNKWNSFDQFMFTESDAATIENKQTLDGKDFILDNNGDIDYSTFQLVGVDSLDDIQKDNVIYLYTVGDKIRKVEVGTETVTGVLDNLTIKTNGSNNKRATVTVDGTAYTMATQNNSKSTDITSHYATGDGDVIDLGDSVVAYLDAYGRIYTFKADESNSSDYALVLNDSGLANATGKVATASADAKLELAGGLASNSMKLTLMTAEGSDTTFTLKDGVVIKLAGKKLDYTDSLYDEAAEVKALVSTGDIVKYSLNAAGEIKEIDVVDNNSITSGILYTDASHSGTVNYLAVESGMANKKVSSEGYFANRAIADNATIFTINTKTYYTSSALTTAVIAMPIEVVNSSYHKIDADDVSVTNLSSILGSDNVYGYGSVIKNQRYSALILSSNVTSTVLHYGIVTDITNLSNDNADTNCKYQVTMLVDGSSDKVTYYTDEACSKKVLYQIKTNAAGEITSFINVAGSIDGTLLGVLKKGSDKVNVDNNTVTIKSGLTVTIASNAIYYNGDKIGTRADMINADAGKVIYFFDSGKSDDQDGVADIIVIGDKVTATNDADSDDVDDNYGLFGSISGITGQGSSSSAPVTPSATIDGAFYATSSSAYTYAYVDSVPSAKDVRTALLAELGESSAESMTGTGPYVITVDGIAYTVTVAPIVTYAYNSGAHTITATLATGLTLTSPDYEWTTVSGNIGDISSGGDTLTVTLDNSEISGDKFKLAVSGTLNGDAVQFESVYTIE